MITITENIRSLVEVDDTELRNSFQTFGWHKEFPAIQDETGTILVGHRRLKIAAELGIEPVIKTIYLANDAEKFKLALISNLGGAPLTIKDRKHIAERLYGTGEWTMSKIAEALGVNRATIGRDLEFAHDAQIKKPAKTKTNPRGAGRPKQRKSKVAQKTPVIVAMKEAGKSAKAISQETGIHERNVHQVLEHDQIAKDARLEAAITPEVLSLTAQKKLDIAIRRETKRLEIEFLKVVEAKVEERIGFLLKIVKADQQQAYEDMRHSRKGGFKFKADVYKKIRQALHPDSRNSISDKRLAEAFDAFVQAERYLVADEEVPSKHPAPPPLPTTMEELLAARERVRKENSERAKAAHAKRQKIS